MVKRKPGGGGGAPVAVKKKGGGQQQPAWHEKPLQTQKGSFVFTNVADGVYIQHKWGQNSGSIGIPAASIGEFAKYLQFFARAHGNPAPKAAGKGPAVSPKGKGIAKKAGGGAAEKAAKAVAAEGGEKKKKEKEKPPKPTTEDLDADLLSYVAGRGGG